MSSRKAKRPSGVACWIQFPRTRCPAYGNWRLSPPRGEPLPATNPRPSFRLGHRRLRSQQCAELQHLLDGPIKRLDVDVMHPLRCPGITRLSMNGFMRARLVHAQIPSPVPKSSYLRTKPVQIRELTMFSSWIFHPSIRVEEPMTRVASGTAVLLVFEGCGRSPDHQIGREDLKPNRFGVLK